MKAALHHKAVDFTVLYLLVGVSGIPYFVWHNEFLVIGTVLTGAVFVARGHRPHVSIGYALVLCYFIELFQAVMFNNLVLSSMAKTGCKLVQAYCAVHLLGNRFFGLFTQFMYVSCWLSLPFFFGGFIPGFTEFIIANICPLFAPAFPITETIDFYVRSDNILIYTFNHNVIHDEIRNSGPFWEPGGFAIFINLALSFSIAAQKRFFTLRNSILIITLLTTFSTGGLAAFFCLVLGYVLSSPTVAAYRVPLLLGCLLAVPVCWTTFSFIGDKFQANLTDYEANTTSRFGSAYVDLLSFVESPLIGFGRRFENIYGQVQYDLRMHRNVGITSLLVHYGIVLFGLYLFYLYQSFRQLGEWTKQPYLYGVFAFLSLLTSHFAQKACEYPFFIGFIFIGALYLHRPIKTNAPVSAKARRELVNI